MRDAQMVVDDGTITSHVKRIRKKFSRRPGFDAIETVYGMGISVARMSNRLWSQAR